MQFILTEEGAGLDAAVNGWGHYFESGWHFDYFSDDLALFQIEVEGKSGEVAVLSKV